MNEVKKTKDYLLNKQFRVLYFDLQKEEIIKEEEYPIYIPEQNEEIYIENLNLQYVIVRKRFYTESNKLVLYIETIKDYKKRK